MLAGHVDGALGFDADLADVVLILHFRTGLQFRLGEDVELLVQSDDIGLGQSGDSVHHALDVGQAAAGCFFHPLVGVTVAVEDDSLVLGQGFLDVSAASGLEIVSAFQSVGGVAECFGQDGVQSGVGCGDGVSGADHTELEPVAGKGEGRGAVAVGGVLLEHGDGGDTGVQGAGGDGSRAVTADDVVDDLFQLRAQEDGDDSGRCFLTAQTVFVAYVRGGLAEQVSVVVDGGDDAGQHQQELQVVSGMVARLEQVFAQVGAHRPVVVLAGAVDASVGLLVEQADQAVLACHPLHGLHGQLVLVHSHVGGGEDGSHLVLCGSHFVVLGGGGDAELPQFDVQVVHKGADSFADLAEVMVIQLLTLGGGCAEQGAAGVDQVPALQVLFPVNQEVFLFRTHESGDLLSGSVAEQVQDTDGFLADCFHRAQQGGLAVQGFAGVGDEDGGDAQDGAGGFFLDKGGGSHVPSGVATGIGGGAQAAVGEGGGVRFAHDELLAGELEQDVTVLIGEGQEGVMLFCGGAGQRLEPVAVMGRTLFHCPVLHGVGHDVSGLHADLAAVFHGVYHLSVHLLRQALLHDRSAEYVGTENLGDRSHNSSTLSFHTKTR